MSEDMIELAERLASIDKPKQLKFGLYKGEGWVTASSAEVIRLLCDVWNKRQQLAAALKDTPRP